MARARSNLDETRQRAREVTGDLRGRLEDLEPVVRERWEELEPAVRQRWEELEPVVRERWEELEPRTRQAQVGAWRGLRVLFGALGVLPGLLLRVLKALAGTADDVAERGQQAGQEALKRRRARGVRVRRRTLVALVVGSVGVGAAAGWVLGRQSAEAERWDFEDGSLDNGMPLDDGASPHEAEPVE